jgi:hypothetical protein
MDRDSSIPKVADSLEDPAYRRMLESRDWIRRWLSPEIIASIPADAPEVIGIHSPDVMRAGLRHRAAG